MLCDFWKWFVNWSEWVSQSVSQSTMGLSQERTVLVDPLLSGKEG